MKIKSIICRTVYVLIQCTWGGLQTLLGFGLFLRWAGSPHQWYRGAVHTKWDINGGISLGMFIFTPDREEEWCRQMVIHEYGHTWQSLMLGPLYLLVVGLPSILWERLEWCRTQRKEKHISYSWFYTERWADRLGAARVMADGQ